MKVKFKFFPLMLTLFLGTALLMSCGDDDDAVDPEPEPECSDPNLSSIFIGSEGSFVAMESTGTNMWEYSIVNSEDNSFTFVFANNATGSNATYGAEPDATSVPNSGTAVEKIVEPDLTCGDNAAFTLTGLEGQNVKITFNSATKAYSFNVVEFNPCTDFSRAVFFIRWRNTTNAGDFSWAEMDPVAGTNGIFEIFQPGSVFYADGAEEPAYGAQILEFSNQPDYGGNLDGELWPLYRNELNRPDDPAKDWTLPEPVDGQTSKVAYYIKVSTRDAQGQETVICDKPEEMINAERGFRLLLFDGNGDPVVGKDQTIRYVIDTFSGEVALFIE